MALPVREGLLFESMTFFRYLVLMDDGQDMKLELVTLGGVTFFFPTCQFKKT
jgi:hypothetical protein